MSCGWVRDPSMDTWVKTAANRKVLQLAIQQAQAQADKAQMALLAPLEGEAPKK